MSKDTCKEENLNQLRSYEARCTAFDQLEALQMQHYQHHDPYSTPPLQYRAPVLPWIFTDITSVMREHHNRHTEHGVYRYSCYTSPSQHLRNQRIIKKHDIWRNFITGVRQQQHDRQKSKYRVSFLQCHLFLLSSYRFIYRKTFSGSGHRVSAYENDNLNIVIIPLMKYKNTAPPLSPNILLPPLLESHSELSDRSYDPDSIVTFYRQHQRRLSDDEIRQVVSRYNEGASTYELADQFGCHRTTISRALKNSGIEVTNELVNRESLCKRVFESYADHISASDIGKELSIRQSKTTIS